MKQKMLGVLFLCLFMNNISAYAHHDRYLKPVSTWKDYPYTSAFDIDVDHNVLYIGVGDKIRIHDANDLKNSQPINTIYFEANVYDLMYTDGFLYVCNDDFGVFVYDVTDLTDPSVVYSDSECLFAKSLHANDMYVVVVANSYDSNLSIYEIDSANILQLYDRIQIPDLLNITNVYIQDLFIYVVDVIEGIFIFELEQLLEKNFQSIGQYDSHSDLKHLLIRDQVGYISDRDLGYSIIDFSNPEDSQEYVSIDIQKTMGSVIVEQYAYVATHETKRLWVFDIENPENIREVEEYPLDYMAYNIHSGNDHIFVSSHSHMHIYQLTQGFPEPQFEAEPRVGQSPLNVSFSNQSSGDIIACKWHFGDGYTRTVFDPSHTYKNPGDYTVTLAVSNGQKWYTEIKANYISVNQPLPKAYFEMTTESRICPIIMEFIQKSSGNYTSVHWDFGDGSTSTEMDPIHEFTTTGLYHVTLTIFAMNDSFQYSRPVYVPNNLVPLTQWNASPIYTFCADSQKKYGFAGSTESINVLDISNPLAISIIQTVPLSEQPESLFYTQNFLLAACGKGGVSIFDTSNPKNISIVSHTPIDSFSRHVWAKDSYAYVSTDLGVLIYSLTTMSAPKYLTKIENIGKAYALKQNDSCAFIADTMGISYFKQTNALDFSNPAIHKIDNLEAFDFDMNYLFLAVRNSGMTILSHNDNGQGDLLIIMGATKEHFDALAICVQNDYAYIAGDDDGFYVYDVHNKRFPAQMKHFQSQDRASDVVDVSPYIFWADGKGGLRIYVQPEQNQLQMQTPRIVHPGQSYKGQICMPYVQKNRITIDLQANHLVTMMDDTVSLSHGTLCQNFYFKVDTLPQELNDKDPQIHFTASAKGWFDAHSFSFMTRNEMIETYSAVDVPLSIPDGKSGKSRITISNEGMIQCLSVQLKMKINRLADLKVTLISPQNISIILFEKVDPGEYLDMIEINLDDRATNNIADAKIPLAGFYQPKEAFSNVNGTSIKGEWTLLIEDKARYNLVQLLAWSMFFELSEVNTPPPLFQQQIKSQSFYPNYHSIETKQMFTNPVIQLINVPPVGNRIRPITGKVHNAVGFSGYLAIYIYTDSWHLKPRWSKPITNFDKNGLWKCDITTKWGDENATKIAVFLFSKECQHLLKPDLTVLPRSLFQKSVAHKIYVRH